MKATLIKKKIEQNIKIKNFHNSFNESSKSINKFVLQCFNRLFHDRKINEIQIASFLLNHSFYYINIENFIIINLWMIKQNVRKLCFNTFFASLIHNSFKDCSKKTSFWNESCRLQKFNSVFHTHFDNYRWREFFL
jgi:hypothetical protein